MIEQYRQGKTKDPNRNTVSYRYSFYKFDQYKTVKIDRDLTLDEISLFQYGTPLYYWAIGEANNISDPFAKIPKGSNIKVPVL